MNRKRNRKRKHVATMLVTTEKCTKKDWHLMDTFHIARRGNDSAALSLLVSINSYIAFTGANLTSRQKSLL